MRWLTMVALVALLGGFVGLAPARASNPGYVQTTGTLNAACATFKGCTQADPVHAGSQICLNMTPPAAVAIQVGGTLTTSVLTVEGSLDGVNAVTPNGGLPGTITSTGTWAGTVSNAGYLCVRMSTYASGDSVLVTINVNNTAGANGGGGGSTSITSPVDGSGNVKVTNQAPVTVLQPTGSNLHTACDSGCVGAPFTYYLVPASATCVTPAVCVIKAAPATFFGLQNPAPSAQPVGSANNCTLYDNASAASGNVLYQENGLGPGQVVTIAASRGLATLNGLVIQCLTNPTGNGLLVYYL